MAIRNSQRQEICCKILYLGAKEAGKTSNLRSILQSTNKELKNGLLHLEDIPGNTPFEFLPLSLTPFSGLHIKIHLFAFSELTEIASDIILRGLDGIVWVIDSRLEKLNENLKMHFNYKELLKRHGIDCSEIVQIFQYNRRDIATPIDPSVLREHFNLLNAPETFAVARLNEGPMATLKLMTRKILLRLLPSTP